MLKITIVRGSKWFSPLAVLVATGFLSLIWLAVEPAHSESSASPAISIDDCVPVEVPGGPEDLVAIPGRKSVIVSVAKRSPRAKQPNGALVRIDLTDCDPKDLAHCAASVKEIYTEGGGKDDFKPVGLVEVEDPSKAELPASCTDGASFAVLAVDDRGGGGVQCFGFDGQGELVGPPKALSSQALGSQGLGKQVNGIGASTRGDVLVTNARGRPKMMFRSGSSKEWQAVHPAVKFSFANGVAFIEPKLSDPNRDPAHALVADFTKSRIHLFHGPSLGSAQAEPLCTFPTPALPDNLHLWKDEKGNARLLVGTFKGLCRSLMHVLFNTRSLVGAAWEVDLGRLIQRLESGEQLPKDCGIRIAHWRLLVEDEESEHLSGTSAAVKVDDLLVVGQLRRPTVLVCPWK